MDSPPPLAVTTMSSRSTSPALSVLDGEGYQEGQEVPAAPVPSRTKFVHGDAKRRGVVYVGRIPHGFYENQMRAYFSQFGPITRLRLSRNRKTGESKHYAFIEFASAEVASIVASTMNSYLLFGHILRCKIVPPEQVHEKLWVGANRKFQVVPRNLNERTKLKLPIGRQAWERRVQSEMDRREKKNKALKSIGYKGPGVGLRMVRDLPVRQREGDNSNVEVAALEPGNPTKETIPEEIASEKKPVDEGSGDRSVEIFEITKKSKSRRRKRKDKIFDSEHENQEHREGSSTIPEDLNPESRPSKRKTDNKKARTGNNDEEVAALKPDSSTKEVISEEKTSKEKPVDEGPGDGSVVISETLKTLKGRRRKRNDKIFGSENEDQQRREGSSSIPGDPHPEFRPSKRKADKEKAPTAKKARRETVSINEGSESEPRVSKRKADSEKGSASKKVRRKKGRSDRESEIKDAAVTEA